MEELRLAASDGLKRLKNGVEIGGVLFGFRESDSLKIMAHRALGCEYAFGPTFTLSNNDRRVLEELMLSPDTDSRLSGMHAVGWYHSHTRAGILLCEKDRQLFQQYFPETWQIALVLRVGHFEPVRATFFFREPDGSVQASSSRHEFIVKPVSGKPDMSLPAAGAPADTAPHLAEWNEQRRERAAEYKRLFEVAGNSVNIPHEPSWSRAVYHLYVVRTEDREGLMAYLKNQSVGTGIQI